MTVVMLAPPATRSFSQLQTFLRCQRQYFLSKVAKVPEQPSVAMVAGSAVHEQIEKLNHEIYERRHGAQAQEAQEG